MKRRMTSKLTRGIVFALAITFTSCGSQDQTKTEELVQTNIGKEQVESILESYLLIKDALVKTDSEKASVEAKKLEASLGGSDDILTRKLYEDAKQIAEIANVTDQRSHFYHLSENIYALVKSKGSNHKLYKQHCSMAFDNNGAYWLSEEEKINNPYFGDQMLHCGNVVETINEVK